MDGCNCAAPFELTVLICIVYWNVVFHSYDVSEVKFDSAMASWSSP